MSSRRPISHFGQQAANSVKNQRQSVSQNHQQRATPTNRPSQGKLTFKQPHAPRIPSSPIVIDDDPTPLEETAASWERGDESFFYEPNRGPYDETWRPMEQDQVEESEDESVARPLPKVRHQPQRLASTRKITGRGVEALQPDAMGMWTPPASNARTRRGGERANERRGSALKGEGKAETPVTSDPVDTPVYRGPSTKATSSKTPLGQPRTENFVEIPPMTARSSALSNPPSNHAAKNACGNISRNADQQGRQWLKKRTSDNHGTQKRTVQTKMTTFINDRPPTQSGSVYRAPGDSSMDVDVFEESVQFVKARNSGFQPSNKTVTTGARIDAPLRTNATISTRPQPQRKKRKSDEIGTSSDGADKAMSSKGMRSGSELLSPRLNAHKRFKVQNNPQQGVQDPQSDDRMDTSSLTSLSKDLSSELDIDQEVTKSGLKVGRGRGRNMAMNVIYSSDADEGGLEERQTDADEVAMDESNTNADVNEDQAPVDRIAPSTPSSVVPDSQPNYYRRSQPWDYYLQAARFQLGPMVEPEQAPNYRTTGIPLRAVPPAVEESLSTANTDPTTISEPSVLPAPATNPPIDPREGDTDGGNIESLVFNDDPEGLISEISQRTENESDPASLSQQRKAAARKEKYRLLLPSLTDDDFEVELVGNHHPAALRLQHDGGDSNIDSASDETETVDFEKFMKKLLPPPVKNKEFTAQPPAQTSAVLESQGKALSEPQAVEVEEPGIPASSAALPLPRPSSNPAESMRRPSEENLSANPVNSKLAFKPTSSEEEKSNQAETMLPLTLDTQLHRPGILSPNFQLRIKRSRQDSANLPGNVKAPITPKKRQRFATQLITPGKQPNLYPGSPEASRTPQQRLILNPDYKSPESMVENVETLATWSPAKYETHRSMGTRQEQWGIDDEEKENQPPQARHIESGSSRALQSLDEIIDGTYGHIQSFHLLETYHRGYTPRKESAVVARENALPRTVKRLHPPMEPNPAFGVLDQAWAGLDNEAPELKAPSVRKAPSRKVDTTEQSKLSQHGFLKNENVRNCPPIDFGRAFKDEDNVMAEDDENSEHGYDRESSSPTPRKAPVGRKLGTVPVPPLDPRLKPAGVREVQRRQRRRETEEHQHRLDKTNNDELNNDGSIADKAQPIERSEDDDVPSSQAYENLDVVFRSDSTNEMELQVSIERTEEARRMALARSRA